MESYNTWPLGGGVSGFFSLMFLRFIHVAECMNTFFLLTNNILLHGYTTFSLTISQLIDIWVVSTFRLLWIKLLWTFVYKFLCGHMLSFHLGMYLWVVLLDHMVTFYIFKFLKNCQTVFQNGCTIFYSHQSYGRVTVTPHPHKACIISLFYYYIHPRECETASHSGFDLTLISLRSNGT